MAARGRAARSFRLTIIGAVSPARGKFDELVTQAMLSTVKCCLGLSSARAYNRLYPAVDPLISWSRRFEQLRPCYEEKVGACWVERVGEMSALLRDGHTVQQLTQVTGEEGVSIEDFITFQKSVLLDMAYLQRDAFDRVDASASLERRKFAFDKLHQHLSRRHDFDDKDASAGIFHEAHGALKEFQLRGGGIARLQCSAG